MNTLLPTSFLFRYAIPVKRIAKLPKRGKTLLGLTSECTIPLFNELDDGSAFAEIRAVWNEKGLGFAAHIRGKQHPPVSDVATPSASDGVRIWVDTRDTKTIHRAGRYCHQFHLLPTGGGNGKDRPVAVQTEIARSREDAPLVASEEIKIAAAQLKSGYSMEVWFSREQLHGFDPEASPRIGFYFHVHDSELGNQYFSVGEEFPFAADPSLWGTLELVS